MLSRDEVNRIIDAIGSEKDSTLRFHGTISEAKLLTDYDRQVERIIRNILEGFVEESDGPAKVEGGN